MVESWDSFELCVYTYTCMIIYFDSCYLTFTCVSRLALTPTTTPDWDFYMDATK